VPTPMVLMKVPGILPPAFNFMELASEIARADIPWTRHYSEYQSGGWWTCALLGRSGDATDGVVTDSVRPLVTNALERLPVTRKLLRELPLRYMIVRLARLDPDGALWEHRDYQDLERVPRQRIHLPLDTNTDSFLVSAGRRFFMAPGSLWSFRPTTTHGACNLGDRPRVHMILDVYEDAPLAKRLAAAERIPAASMPELSPEELAQRVRDLRATLGDDDGDGGCDTGAPSLRRWERAVLALYFAFTLPEGELYDALAREYRRRHAPDRAAFWADRRRLVLGKGLVDA
jgi:Aspartyl/Asparaginyl beta-hydroxylase